MKLKYLVLSILFISSACTKIPVKENGSSGKVIVAYVTSWSKVMPDPLCMTHINYAFGHVNNSFDGVRIDNENRLKMIVALKAQNPNLNVMLSIGGWGSGRFSEMAADKKKREAFAKDCKRVIKEFNLDGIDVDWEYPTSSVADISSSPEDTKNFTLLMSDIRKAIGKDKLLTLASSSNAKYVDFKAIDPYINFINIMSYDMATAPKHHSALFRSDIAGYITGEEAVNAHLRLGVSPEKLTLGMPFYGRGIDPFPKSMNYKDLLNSIGNFTENWDDIAKVPYLTDDEGVIVFGYENPRSIAIKCDYIHQWGLLGGMYWDYDGDNQEGDLRRTVYECLIKSK